MKSIRILYHNVLGYNLTKAGNEVADRADTMLAIYQEYQPDILCFQEMTAEFRKDDNAQELMNWLNENYIEKSFDICLLDDDGKDTVNELVDDGGTPTPIFIRRDSGLTVVEAGYIRARAKATKGTTWAILQDASGKEFCVSDSHFVSPTEQGAHTDYLQMRAYRTEDATSWLNVLAGLLTEYPELPVISGGDFNAGREYSEPDGALTPWELFIQQGYTDIRSDDLDSIDHALCMGDHITVTYQVLPGDEDAWGSDHAPHFADIIVN